eukprot:5350822-Heterocapsa_arctica.AAC.1
METKLEEIEVTQEATKHIMTMDFKDTETSIQAEHDYIKDKFRHMEEDILGVRHLVKDMNNKRKSNE